MTLKPKKEIEEILRRHELETESDEGESLNNILDYIDQREKQIKQDLRKKIEKMKYKMPTEHLVDEEIIVKIAYNQAIQDILKLL